MIHVWHVVLNVPKPCYCRTCRKTTQRTIEELTISITDVESRLKGESTRARKKYEGLIVELEAQLDAANKALAAAMKENKNLFQRARVRIPALGNHEYYVLVHSYTNSCVLCA